MGITEIIKEKMNEPMSIFFKEYDYDGEYSYICIRPQYLALKQGGAYMFKLRLPKIPADIYNCIVSLFSKVAQLYNIECLARVYWDISNQDYKLVFPSQMASICSVSPLESESSFCGNYLKVLEIHSHGRAYSSFWSDIDDDDEVISTGVYGVMSFNSGTGFDCTESALYRFCCGEKERIINLEKNDLFIDAPFNYEGAFVKHILESNKIKF